MSSWQQIVLGELLMQIWHSVSISLMSAVAVAVVALFIAIASGLDKSRYALIATKISTLGYAIPGTVLAVGVFVPVAWLDNWLNTNMAVFSGSDAIFKENHLCHAHRFIDSLFGFGCPIGGCWHETHS